MDRSYSRYERKRQAKRRKSLMLTGALLILFFVLFLIIGFSDGCSEESAKGKDNFPQNTSGTSVTEETESELNQNTEETEVAVTFATEHTEAESVPELSYPENLQEFLSINGNSVEDLEELGCSQLVVVNSFGTSAEIRYFSEDNGVWSEDEDLFCYGYVGLEGTVYEMSEQVSGTPKGLYPIGEAFYIYSEPQTGLDVFEVTNDTYWVDDPDSQFYNQRVEGTDAKDWNSAEHMIEYDYNYNYGFVINYNMPAEYNKGSAIFFHIGNSPTQGCVATSEYMVLQYLANLSARSNPLILVI